MSFRLWTIFYVFALVAAALATFGPGGGIFAAVIVLGVWGWVSYLPKQNTVLNLLLTALAFIVLMALLLPAVSSARQAARRNQCQNNLKQIALALHIYHDVNGTFPPAYLADATGKPMHSWRVLILPYAQELTLYQAYNFNEPWDGPNNRKLAARMSEVFRCPAHADGKAANRLETSYFAIVAPETAWGRAIGQIPDGTSKTVMVIEASGLGVD